jgi:hypothetical protein
MQMQDHLFATSASCSVNFSLGVLCMVISDQCPPHPHCRFCDTVECCSQRQCGITESLPLICTSTHMPIILALLLRVSQTHDSRGH